MATCGLLAQPGHRLNTGVPPGRALAGYGVGTSTGAVTFNSLPQATAPPQARGRVFATFDLTWQVGRLASLALGGVTVDTVGIPAVYAAGAVPLAAGAAIGAAGLRTR